MRHSGGKAKDLTGMRFGRLTVLEFCERRGRFPYWICKCDCGKTVIKSGYSMMQGNTKSCGCLAKEHTEELHRKKKLYKHSGEKILSIWRTMIGRCENPNNSSYKRYGARGIYVCAEWKDPDVFAEWAYLNGYQDGYSIERIDNDGPYAPYNCRFATKKEQANNRRTNVVVEYCGTRKTIAEWSEKSAVSASTLYYRYHSGWDFGKALVTPANSIPRGTPVSQYSKSGKLIKTFQSAHEASKATGIFVTSICDACNGKLKTSGGYIWRRESQEG